MSYLIITLWILSCIITARFTYATLRNNDMGEFGNFNNEYTQFYILISLIFGIFTIPATMLTFSKKYWSL